MPRTPKRTPDLAAYLRDELAARNLTLTDLEAATGIPDATLSRIFSGEVKDPKGSQLARIAQAMQIPAHVILARAGITDTAPADATAELQRIAAIISDKPELQSILDKLIGLSPRDIRAVRKYIELLRSD
jgi:transcriptional regulator with XRE-family HTH domain